MAKPQIIFTPEAWDWMRGYTLAVDTEIGGFGYVTSPEKGVFVVDTIYLAPQEVSGGGVHFKEGAMGYMVEKAIDDERVNDARFSWHSHNTMGVFWSSTDEEGIRDYKNTGMPWVVSAVVNHEGKIKCRVDVFDSILDHITIEDTEVRVGVPDPAMNDEIMADIAQLVTKRPTQATNTTTGNNSKSGGSSHNSGKHRPAGTKQQPALPAGNSQRTSSEWWDEIDWSAVTDEELAAIMKEHGFDVEAEVAGDNASITPDQEDEDAARQMAAIEAMH